MSTSKGRPLPWWPRQFAADEHVLLMSLEAEGAYRRLLDHQWLHGSIPADSRAQAAICKGIPPGRMRRLWGEIGCCFHACDDPSRLHNRRLEAIRSADEEWRMGQVAAGRKGAAKRWARHSDPNDYPNDYPTGEPNDHPTTYPNSQGWPPSPSPSPSPRTTTPSSARACAGVPEAYQPDLDALRRASHAPDALDREIQALLSGQHPTLGTLTPEDVGVGIRELSLAGAPASKLSRFVAVARDRRANPTPARRGKPPEPESFEAAAARVAAEGR